MPFHKLYDWNESHRLTGPNLDPRVLLHMTARKGRALVNNICFVEYVTDSRNPEARTYRQIPRAVLNKILYGESPPEVQYLPFYILLLTEKRPLSYTFN